MSRRNAILLIGLLLTAGAAALAVLPARWLMLAIPAHWPLAVIDASGTVWSGSAVLAVGPRGSRRALPNPVRWQWSISRGPKLEVNHPWLSGPLILAPSLTNIMISPQALQLPAQALSTLDPRIAAVDPGGRLSLSWPAVHVGRHARPGGARLLDAEWRDAVSALTPIRPLGHYTLALTQSATGGADLTLGTQQGPLLLEGAGALSASGGFQFKGTARSAPAASPEVRAALQDLLSALGPRQNDSTLLHYR